MDLLSRARALKALGFLNGVEPDDLPAFVEEVQEDPDWNPASPATGLFLVAGELLEIPDVEIDPADYEDLIRDFAELCEEALPVGDVRFDESRGRHAITFTLGGGPKRLELDPEASPDLSFLTIFEEYFRSAGEPRRICPIVESMDDTARYVFALPESVEQAELDELIAAPELED